MKLPAQRWSTAHPNLAFRGRRDALAQLVDLRPRILFQTLQAARQVRGVELVGTDALLQFLPGNRHRDGRSRLCPGRIRSDEGGRALVAQEVDVNTAFASFLRHVGREAFGRLSGHLLDYRLGECLDLVPIRSAPNGRHYMKALAAGGLEKAF